MISATTMLSPRKPSSRNAATAQSGTTKSRSNETHVIAARFFLTAANEIVPPSSTNASGVVEAASASIGFCSTTGRLIFKRFTMNPA